MYPGPSSDERIKQLEATIRSLGGEDLLKESSATPDGAGSETSPSSKGANASSVERDIDRSIYLES